jgi:spore coat-associated protein N
MERLKLLIHSRHWLALAALALLALALGSAMFSGASFTSKSANSATLAAGSVKLSSSAPNQAIVSASGMQPGVSREGTIRIGNEGDVNGSVILEAAGLTGTALASVLDLKIEEVEKSTTVQKWSGKLGSFTSVALGTIAASKSREYKLTLSWPPTSSEASLQGASTSLTFKWSGRS